MIPEARKLQIISIAQVACYIFMVVPLRLMTLSRRDIDPDIARLKRGTLVVANHQWFLDPFVVLAHLPLLSFLALLPIRFPVKHKFMKNRAWQCLRLVGAYDLGTTPREKMIGLYRARQLLKQKVTIFLFPEGNVNRTGYIHELQRGIEYLMDENTPLMLVRLRGFYKRDVSFLWDSRSVVFLVPRSSGKVSRHEIQKILQSPTVEY